MKYLVDLVFEPLAWTGSGLTEEHEEYVITYLLNYYLDREVNGTVGHWVHLLSLTATDVSQRFVQEYSKMDWGLISPDSGYLRNGSAALTSNDSGSAKGTSQGTQDTKRGAYPFSVDADDNDQDRSHNDYAGSTGQDTSGKHDSNSASRIEGRNEPSVDLLQRQLAKVYNIDTELVFQFEKCYNVLV